MQAQKFKKITEAMQFDGTDACAEKIAMWVHTFCSCAVNKDPLTGWLGVDGQWLLQGDYVIHNMKDYPHVIAREAFELTYLPDDAYVSKCTREVLDHRVEGKGGGADDTRVLVLDEPGQGGANHEYAVTDGAGKVLLRVSFQNGPIQECGVNGAQQEHLLAIVIDRLRSFQAGPFGNRYNAIALTESESVLMWLQRRTVDRVRRGVEGFNKV